MINRLNQPDLVELEQIEFVEPIKYQLTDKVNLYHMKDVPNETTRLDLYFDAGKCKGSIGIPSFVNGLLLSGTIEKTSIQINGEINSLGGFFDSGVAMENSVISIYCLKENLKEIFNTLINAIQKTAFIEKEVKEYLADRKQSFNINLKKVGFLAQRKFQNKLFISNSFYASTINEEDIDKITIDDLKKFHEENYVNGLNKIVLVGDINDNDVQYVLANCRSIATSDSCVIDSNLINTPSVSHVPLPGALQSAVKIGRILFNKKHEDYLDFMVLNTILGDYFGSRLMSNIREDKGYTYGIGSNVAEFNDSGYFIISTEVGKDVKDATLEEIKNELARLQNELVPDSELELIKNYILGQILKSADGPYAMMDLFLSADIHGLSIDFYNQAIYAVKEITPERIQELAKKYLNWDEMVIVTAG